MASNSNSVLTRSNKGDKAKQNSIASYMSQNNKTNPKDGVTTDILNEILAKLNEQGKALNNLQSDVSIVKTDISNIKTIVKECVAEELADRDEAWQKEKEIIYSKMSVLEQRDESRAKNEKKNNIVVKGMLVTSNDIKNEVRSFLQNKVEVEVSIIDAYEVKLKKGSLIVAKLETSEDKRLVMENKHKLYGSEFYINHDRTTKEREIQNKIYKLAEIAKANGSQVKVGYMKLIINGVTKKWKQNVGLVEVKTYSFQSPDNHNESNHE